MPCCCGATPATANNGGSTSRRVPSWIAPNGGPPTATSGEMTVWWRAVSKLCLATLCSTTTPTAHLQTWTGVMTQGNIHSSQWPNRLRAYKSPSTMPEETTLTSKASPCRLSYIVSGCMGMIKSRSIIPHFPTPYSQRITPHPERCNRNWY